MSANLENIYVDIMSIVLCLSIMYTILQMLI